MMNFEKPPEKFESIDKVFEYRKKYIPEIGEQLREKTSVEVEIGSEKLEVDYREVSVESLENKDGDVVVLLPGFGSGWEGISELGFSLACEGRRVIMPSLPGYGNSENPSKEYYSKDDFDNEAEVINQLIEKLVEKGDKVHLIGHSMASEVLASFAQNYPDKVSSLVPLNPSGVEDEKALPLGVRFAASGMASAAKYNIRLYFSGEKDYQKGLKEFIPKTKSPFSKDRIMQRLSEANRLMTGKLLRKIEKTSCPVIYISGEFDVVHPSGEEGESGSQLQKIIEAVGDATRLEKSVMAKLHHNTTIAPDEITAANIDHYMNKAENKRKKKNVQE
ncbi:alpha/beta fold hydrolase [Patescibacteria group bacterium]